MLLQLTNPIDDDHFQKLHKELTKVYWPRDKYLDAEERDTDQIKRIMQLLPAPESLKSKDDDDKIRQVKDSIKDICEEIGAKALYPAYFNHGKESNPEKYFPLPFLDRYHQYFAKRKWDEPIDDPRAETQEYFHLNSYRQAENPSGKKWRNYSHNVGDFKHFINVVSALSRLIAYFRDIKSIEDLFKDCPYYSLESTTVDTLPRTLLLKNSPDLRTFKLMLAGFYHDIGKTVDYPRHGLEGSIILAFHTSRSRSELYEITKFYFGDTEFRRDDLYHLAHLVLYHDQYGTLATGEDSYVRLHDMIGELERFSPPKLNKPADHADEIRKNLFDSWLLNVADIMVSVSNKREIQDQWLEKKTAEESIRSFLFDTKKDKRLDIKGPQLIHDLALSFDILNAHLKERQGDDPYTLETHLINCSKRHAVDRLRRLILASLRKPVNELMANTERLLDDINKTTKEDPYNLALRVIKFLGCSVNGINPST